MHNLRASKLAFVVTLSVVFVAMFWLFLNEKEEVQSMNPQATEDPREMDTITVVDSIAWSPDGTYTAIASGDYDGPPGTENFRVWVINTTTSQVIFSAPHEGAATLLWSPSGQELFISSRNGAIHRYNVFTGALEVALAGRDMSAWYGMDSLSLSPNGNRIATIFTRLDGNQTFTIYDAQSLQTLLEGDLPFQYDSENAQSWIGYSPDGSFLATTGWDGLVRMWDANTVSLLSTLTTAPGQRLYVGAWTPDGRLAVGGEDKRITIWNTSTGEMLNSIDTGSGFTSIIRSLRWHPDGRQIATSRDVWDGINGQLVQPLDFDPDEIQGYYVEPSGALDWSPAGVLSLGISAGGRLQIDPATNPLDILVSTVSVPSLPSPTPTNTPTSTPTSTPTDTPTATSTDTPTATSTSTPTDTPTATATATATATTTPTATPTATATPMFSQLNGLYGEYYNDKSFSDFAFARADPIVNFSWGAAGPSGVTSSSDGGYAVRWTGTVLPQYSETYTFHLGYNGTAKLWVNGQLLIDDMTSSNGSPDTRTGTIALTANVPVTIRLDYNNNFPSNENQLVRLKWLSASQPEQVIPNSRLFHVQRGSGTGLRGQYYDDAEMTQLMRTRTDAAVDFDWGTGAPSFLTEPTSFAVRWTGQVQPLYSEAYTFRIYSDDGVRLWVNGQQLIDDWTTGGFRSNTGTITLEAGVKYDITLDYREANNNANVQLLWQSASQYRQVIPQTQLYVPAA